MANPEHLKILRQGALAWNQWRVSNFMTVPDLSNAQLSGLDLYAVHPLENDEMALAAQGVDFSHTDLSNADLTSVTIVNANLYRARLEGANFSKAILLTVDFSGAAIDNTNFTGATIAQINFGDNYLNLANGLDTIRHTAPSYISTETLFKSEGKIPRSFLEGCGVPAELIVYLSSILTARNPIQFYSCFISYSTKDEEFARRLYSRMRDENLRVWFAPEDIKGGQKLHEQIERAIQFHDRLLLILSERSMQSEWVTTEIQKARETEIKEKRRKLFPITIVDFDKVKTWNP
jgi:uncharacterized protein YjbI with pentapeptide repeats